MVEENKGKTMAEKFIEAGEKRRNLELVRKTLEQEKLYDKVGKGEIKSYRKFQKKEQAGRNTISDIKYRKSFGGRLQAVGSFIRHPTESIYRRNLSVAQLKAFDKMNKARRPMQPQQRVYRRPQQQPTTFFDSVFRAGDLVAPVLEAEIYGSKGRRGVCSDGDREAGSMNINSPAFRSVDNEANFFAGMQHVNPVVNISREVHRHSKLQHHNAVKGVSQEADFYSHLLD